MGTGSAAEERNRGGRPRRVVDLCRIAALRQQGLSFRKIAKELSLGEGTVRRAFQAPTISVAARQNPKATHS